MNLSLISLEVCVLTLGLVLLLADLWLPVERKKLLGYAAAAGLGLLLVLNLTGYGNREGKTQGWTINLTLFTAPGRRKSDDSLDGAH